MSDKYADFKIVPFTNGTVNILTSDNNFVLPSGFENILIVNDKVDLELNNALFLCKDGFKVNILAYGFFYRGSYKLVKTIMDRKDYAIIILQEIYTKELYIYLSDNRVFSRTKFTEFQILKSNNHMELLLSNDSFCNVYKIKTKHGLCSIDIEKPDIRFPNKYSKVETHYIDNKLYALNYDMKTGESSFYHGESIDSLYTGKELLIKEDVHTIIDILDIETRGADTRYLMRTLKLDNLIKRNGIFGELIVYNMKSIVEITDASLKIEALNLVSGNVETVVYPL